MDLNVNTKKKEEILDITDLIKGEIKKQEIESGVLVIFVKHTTCAITTGEFYEGIEKDYFRFLKEVEPKLDYQHAHDPTHTPDHIYSSIIGTSLSVPIEDEKLDLGEWQKVLLIEFNGPRKRVIRLKFLENE